MAAGSRWTLRGFDTHIDSLGDLSPAAWQELVEWLGLLAVNPVAVPRSEVDMGVHLGETLPEHEREEPFPLSFRSWIPTGDGRAIRFAYFVKHNEWAVVCIGAKWEAWG